MMFRLCAGHMYSCAVLKKLMNRTLKNDAGKGSWQDSWEVISIKWMYYKEKEEKVWIVFFFFSCDIAVSLRGTQIGVRLELDDMSNIMEINPSILRKLEQYINMTS